MAQPTIRNREAAGIQITAEQLIKDARTQFNPASSAQAPGSSYLSRDEFRIQDKEELHEFLQSKRKEYEERLRRHRKEIRSYLDYARFEAAQEDYRRCRSILERGLSVLAQEPALWLAYSEIEAKGGFINHALNVLNRAVGILPRVDSLWYKYVLYQETLGSEEDTRAIFERWMAWEPKSEEPWFAYAHFEERHSRPERARDVYERFCGLFPTARAYIKYAKWEDQANRIANARNVFERAIGAAEGALSELSEEELKKPDLWLAFAQFEQRRNEPERARAIYEFALSKVDSEFRGKVFASFVAFEKRAQVDMNGDGDASNVVILRRREEYEKQIKADPSDYDAWFDLVRLEEAEGSDRERIRDTYHRAQANVPKDASDKRAWRRFVYLFIYEALFEELVAKDVDRARQVLKRALEVVPHTKFTFAKLWIMLAQLEIRQKNLTEARKVLGRAIGLCPKDKLFRTYIQLELQLGQVDRCRTLYEKYLSFNPANAQAWSRFAEMERSVGEWNRARAIYELGVAQNLLDEPEKLWMRFIDFEIASDEEEEDDEDKGQQSANKSQGSGQERALKLYQRLLERTEKKQPRIWVAMAKFLALSPRFGRDQAREALETAETHFKALKIDEARATICEARVDLERALLGMDDEEKEKDRSILESALERVPKRLERADESTGEIKVEFVFPRDVKEEAERKANDEEAQKRAATLKMLEALQQRKKMKQATEQSSS